MVKGRPELFFFKSLFFGWGGGYATTGRAITETKTPRVFACAEPDMEARERACVLEIRTLGSIIRALQINLTAIGASPGLLPVPISRKSLVVANRGECTRGDTSGFMFVLPARPLFYFFGLCELSVISEW